MKGETICRGRYWSLSDDESPTLFNITNKQLLSKQGLLEVRGSLLVVLLDENKRNIKCVDVSKIQMSDTARARNVSSFPFLRMVGPPTNRVVWPS